MLYRSGFQTRSVWYMNKILILPVLAALVCVLSFSTQHALAAGPIDFDLPVLVSNFDSTLNEEKYRKANLD